MDDVEVAERSTAVERQVRLKFRFPGSIQMNAALSTEAPGDILVQLGRRNVISVAVPEVAYLENSERWRDLERWYDAQIVEDYRNDLEDLEFFDPSTFSPEIPTAPSLDDVTREIGAYSAWGVNRGRNVIIAIVDTGIDGTCPEFSPARRVPETWAPIGEDTWADWQGHGTMCAAIAAGAREDGGRFDGIAPEARIMSCRTHFYDTELAAIYDQLSELSRAGNLVIATNSYGIRTGSPPPPREQRLHTGLG